MAEFIEPVIIQNVNKDVAPNCLDYSGRKIINPVRDVLNGRYLSSEDGEQYQLQNVKGNEEVVNSEIFKLLTVNGLFDDGLDGWDVITIPSSLSWSAVSGHIRVSGSSADGTDMIAQAIDITSGKNASINCHLKILSGTVTTARIIGYFLDNDDNIITSFTVVTTTSIVVGFDDRNVTIQQLVPDGAAKIAFAGSISGVVSPFVIEVRIFNLSGYQTLSLPDGINECIGTFENIEKNLLIYFNYNSNGYHGVFKYDSSLDEIYQIIADDPSAPVLNFSNNPRHAITGVGMIGDILKWSDNLNPQRSINISREYLSLDELTVSLYKIGPKNKPTFDEKYNNASQPINKLAVNSIQVAHRYVYLDNEVSVLSPFSDIIVAEAYGNDRVFLNKRNSIDITFPVDSDVSSIIKYVELLYRINNSDSWLIFNRYSNFGSTIVETFTNESGGESVSVIATSKLFDSIPNKSKALIVYRNRVFLNINEEGMEVPELVITPSLGTDLDSSDVPTNGSGAYLKKNGQYSVAAVVSDLFGRFVGAYAKKKLNGKAYVMDTYTALPDANNLSANRLDVAVSGQVPVGSRYSIVLKSEQQYAAYFQTWARPYLYKRESALQPARSDTNEDEYRGHVYARRTTSSDYTPANMSFAYIHLILPLDIPFTPDNTYSVRILNKGTVYITEKILEVLDGNIIVTGKFNLPDYNDRILFVEIFKIKDVPDTFYYEVSGPHESSGGVPVVTSIEDIKGDTYYRGAYGQALPITDDTDVNYKVARWSPDIPLGGGTTGGPISTPTQIESPSPTYTMGQASTAVILIAPQAASNLSSKGYALDYSKAAWGRGRPFVESIPAILRRPSTIRFSDVFVEGSNINGLNSFPVENIYDKIGQDRSPITKLLAVGNVILAIHERNTTTLYIGEGIVKAGETGFLAKVDAVVGDDNKLIGNYGSYHPESVAEENGMAFGFDIFSGCVWRYTVEGQHPVSDYGMKSFFRDKARDYSAFRDELKFVGAIDKYNKEYLITLPHKYSTLQTADLIEMLNPSVTYDLVLDTEDYEEGEVYRLKIVIFKQTETDDDNVSVSASLDGTTPVGTSIIQNITTYVEAEAIPVYIEFTYGGEGFIRLSVASIENPINVRLSSEYQEIKGETWGFNYERKVWTSRYSFVPEFMGKVGNSLLSFKNGKLYKHNVSDVYNNFYGIQYQREIRPAVNPKPGKNKIWTGIQIAGESICADESSTFRVMECSNDRGQSSYTRAKDFENKEGVYYAPILKDVTTNPALLKAGRIPLRDGKDMRSKSLELTIYNDRSDRSLMQKLNIVGEYSEFST
jgi:hypothetical protein